MQPAKVRLLMSSNYDRSKKFDYFKSVVYERKYFFSEIRNEQTRYASVDGVKVHIQWMVFPKNHTWHIVGSASDGEMEKLPNEGWSVITDGRGWKHFEIDQKTCKPSKFVAYDPAVSPAFYTTPPPSFRAQVAIEKIVGEFCKWKAKNPPSELLHKFEQVTFDRQNKLRSRIR
jgi:hypothetical protein